MSGSPLVVVPQETLIAMIEAAVERVLVSRSQRVVEQVERVSAARAAALIRRRRALVLEACESGELPATRQGNRWSIAVRDLDVWAAKGSQP